MRTSWILLALAAATLIFLMILRPGGSLEDEPREFEASEERTAERQPAETARSERNGEPEARRERRESPDAETDVEDQEESDRPEGGYDQIGQMFHTSSDYHGLVEDIMEAANEGDSAAQYYLSRILSQCRLAVNHFDGEFPDEQRMASATPSDLHPDVDGLMMEQVSRCQGFFDDSPDNYGEADAWLQEAAADGYGPAVMKQGINQYRHWNAGRDADFDPNAIVQTLRDRNPETLSYASQLSAVANSPAEDEKAWLMLACEYGQDCSADADWVRALCLQEGCPPGYEDAEDALSILMSPGEHERAKDRMEELERALDAGDFESLFP